jgi:hypothetical protein
MREHDWACDGIVRQVDLPGHHNTIYGWTCKVCKGVTWTQGKPDEGPGVGSLENSGVSLACPPTAWERLMVADE